MQTLRVSGVPGCYRECQKPMTNHLARSDRLHNYFYRTNSKAKSLNNLILSIYEVLVLPLVNLQLIDPKISGTNLLRAVLFPVSERKTILGGSDPDKASGT